MFNIILDLANIQNKITSFNSVLKKQYYEYLEKEFSVLFTFHSNRIEGTNITLTLNDTRKIINNTYDFKSVIDINKKREINETLNHQNASKYIFDILDKDIDIIDVIKQIHSIIGNNVIDNAGKYKKIENYLINSVGKEIVFTEPKLVETRMQELKENYEGKWQELTVFERAIFLHMAIINIHPFSDGNGRVARLLMNYELMKNNYPPIIINESQKLSYYTMLEEINLNTDYQNKPLEIGNIKLLNETVMLLSVMTFKNMQEYFKTKN